MPYAANGFGGEENLFLVSYKTRTYAAVRSSLLKVFVVMEADVVTWKQKNNSYCSRDFKNFFIFKIPR